MGTKIILGSASPRRRELLSQIGIGFTVRVSDKEEVYHSDIPEEIVKELALMKAENVASEIFGELSDGRVKVKGTQAKAARGEMVRWMAENQITRAADVRDFDSPGWHYQEDLSTDREYVFVR